VNADALCPFRNNSPGACELDELGQSSCFGACDGVPERSELVITAAFVIFIWIRPPFAFDDKSLFLHALNRSIERSGAHAKLAVRSHRNVLNNGVAVPAVICQGHQNVKRGRRQGKKCINVGLGVGHVDQL